MVLCHLKWLKGTSFYERKKEIIIKTRTLHERKVQIKKKGRIYEFSDKRKEILWISVSKRRCFSTQEAGRTMTFP